MKPTPEQLRELLSYDPKTGLLTWRSRSEIFFRDLTHSAAHCAAKWNARWAGKPAMNNDNGNGYKCGRLFNKQHYAHRVAFALVHGYWPEEQVDHINGLRNDNRIDNLRSVSVKENHKNLGLRSSNTSGTSGVSWCQKSKTWRARVQVNGKEKIIGYFPMIEEARAARKAAEIAEGYHPNHGRA